MSYPKLVEHRGVTFRGYLHEQKGLVIYRPTDLMAIYHHERKILGILALGPGWQDMDRTYTAQDIYWEDKYDCTTEQGRALLVAA